jgi:hypothetical protein
LAAKTNLADIFLYRRALLLWGRIRVISRGYPLSGLGMS